MHHRYNLVYCETVINIVNKISTLRKTLIAYENQKSVW